jgi:hypothetical protein
LIDRFGGNREKIYAAAETLKQGDITQSAPRLKALVAEAF